MAGERLRWLATRVAAMEPGEWRERVAEAVRRRRDARVAWRDRLPRVSDALARTPVPALPVASADAVAGLPEAWRGALAADAASLLSGPFTLLGARWSDRRAWGVDPATGTPWPAVPTHRIGFRDDPRDIKLAWELERLQHLQVLAWAAALGDDGARAAVLADLEDWFARHRPFEGVAWAVGIECASRVASLLAVASLLGPGAVPDRTRAAWWSSLQAHGFWLARHPSIGSSANNHRVAELAALWVLGHQAPDLAGADAWRGVGPELLDVAVRQVHRDGVGTEQSPTYLAYSLEWLLLARQVAFAHGRPLAVDPLLRAGADFLVELMEPSGRHPRIGDDDEGVVLRQRLAPDRLAVSVASAIAAALRDDGLAPPTGGPDPRGALLGLQGRAGAARSGSRGFPEGGLAVLRGALGAHRAQVVVDHGPLGFGRTAGHGHADALSVWLQLDGQPVVVDFGTYRYNGAPAWRAWARSTAAHPTATLDGRGQAEPVGAFAWRGDPRAALVEADLAAGRVVAEHHGWAPAVHRRTVHLDGTLRVEDVVEGEGRMTVHWPLAPDLEPVREEGDWLIRRGDEPLLRLAVRGAAVRRVRGGAAPGPGCVSPRYGSVEPSWSLLLEAEGSRVTSEFAATT